jgi:hypothetical protein
MGEAVMMGPGFWGEVKVVLGPGGFETSSNNHS